MKNKVSILTPVYNGESYVARFIDSVMNQTYDGIKVELIIINDGSTDNTKEIIMKYVNDSPNKNVKIKYLEQENGGQASAVANGIKHVTGEFMTWADSDDYYEGDAILKMVNYLKNNKDTAIVRCNAYARDENNIEEILYELKVQEEYQDKKDIFEDCILIKGINAFSGVYMARFSKYKENNPDLYFYEGKQGQNWQLLLPVLYKNKCDYLDEFVYNYVIRKDSHSHVKKNLNQQIERIIGLRDILFDTIKMLKLDLNYHKKIINLINEKYDLKLYQIYCKLGDRNKVKEFYKKIHNKNLKNNIFYFIGTNKLCNQIFKKIKKVV